MGCPTPVVAHRGQHPAGKRRDFTQFGLGRNVVRVRHVPAADERKDREAIFRLCAKQRGDAHQPAIALGAEAKKLQIARSQVLPPGKQPLPGEEYRVAAGTTSQRRLLT